MSSTTEFLDLIPLLADGGKFLVVEVVTLRFLGLLDCFHGLSDSILDLILESLAKWRCLKSLVVSSQTFSLLGLSQVTESLLDLFDSRLILQSSPGGLEILPVFSELLTIVSESELDELVLVFKELFALNEANQSSESDELHVCK